MASSVEITGLVKKYRETTALASLDLFAPEGEMLGFIGPDGAGKTTTMRILCGLLNFDAGQCRIGGFDLRAHLAEIRKIIGYMPQRFSLYPDLTVAENLNFFADLFNVPSRERKSQIERLLQFSRLEPFLTRRAAALSGGMKQKLALSCALIHKPHILFLDEPTTGVDPVSRQEFWRILYELRAEGVTILVSTPYMDEAAKCDRVTFLNRGKVMLHDRPAHIPSRFTGEILELICRQSVKVAQLLKSVAHLDAVHIFGDRIHIFGTNLRSRIPEIESLLRSAAIDGNPLTLVPASLEDVFVQLSEGAV